MALPEYLMPATLAVFNVATVTLIAIGLRGVNFEAALAEKGPVPAQSTSAAGQPSATTPEPTRSSYSRIAGMIGAVVMATFFWGVANVVLVRMISDPGSVATMLQGVSSFILAGSAMFLPYATNQLRELFSPQART